MYSICRVTIIWAALDSSSSTVYKLMLLLESRAAEIIAKYGIVSSSMVKWLVPPSFVREIGINFPEEQLQQLRVTPLCLSQAPGYGKG